ncbi:MAG: Malonyl CoA-acyl carrier protein transacylase [Chlamydiales bacterium]|nr:Malonyl CoA-acyl carrier protein transacylase [Chlamydiales bacterium]MCH9620145.1 Malonyl CoA-acyl carrier protein transacylase [Chlamydiales bacterium]MCH9623615.1 Malonyl CoA-acyl carrier protein transacylase [Chlamydiales bacterium]
MSKKIAFIFPGQGSQVVGMGKEFYDSHAVAREVFKKGDAILQRELSSLMFNGPEEDLLQTRNSQTAIYLNSMAILAVLQEEFPTLHPTICSGHSLGEYSALTATSRISIEECLPLVQLRSEAMNDACVAHPGKMAAVLGLANEQIEEVVAEVEDLWAANYNCPGQVVISGTAEGVEKGMALAKERGAKRAILLPVHGAFHSGLMSEAQKRLGKKLSDADLKESSIQFVMNVVGDFVSDPEEIRNNLINQVTSSVKWAQGIEKMKGVDLFIEVGGKVLAGMNKKIGVEGQTISISKLSDLEKLKEAVS